MEVDSCKSRLFSTKIQARSAHFDERSSRTTSVMCINPGHIVTPVTPSARRGQARINSQEDFAMSEPVTPLTNDGVGDAWAPRAFPEDRTTIKRNPGNDLIMVNERRGEVNGPLFGEQDLGGVDNDTHVVKRGRL